jgi:hypothetical protein
VCTTGDTAHIDTILKFLPHRRQHGCIDILRCCNDPCFRSERSSGNGETYTVRPTIAIAYLNGIFHSHRKTEKSFFDLPEISDMCTTGDTAHIDTIFKFLSHTTWVHRYSILLQLSMSLGSEEY